MNCVVFYSNHFILFAQMGYYKTVNAMAKDIDLMAKNAKTYNEPGSQVFKVNSFSWFCSMYVKTTQILTILFCRMLTP